MKRIAVFCGSNMGLLTEYEKTARKVGKILAENNIELVYGGGNVGMMRCVAEEVMNGGGKVIGVITHFLKAKHLAQPGLTQLIEVETMQERKATMAELSDGFIILPGGFGTLEEFFEVLTAAQLGFHSKPIGVVNQNGFYNFLKQQIDHMVEHGMVLPVHSGMVLYGNSADEVFNKMKEYEAPSAGKWIEDILEANGHKK